MDLINVMKALADETRIRILNLLKEGELCVCELELLMNINQSNASRHLNKLTTAKLITFEKRALYVYYKINQSILEECPFLKEFMDKELNKLKKYEQDKQNLMAYKQSGITCEELKDGKICFYKSKEDSQ